jgi:hypothetical protein
MKMWLNLAVLFLFSRSVVADNATVCSKADALGGMVSISDDGKVALTEKGKKALVMDATNKDSSVIKFNYRGLNNLIHLCDAPSIKLNDQKQAVSINQLCPFDEAERGIESNHLSYKNGKCYISKLGLNFSTDPSKEQLRASSEMCNELAGPMKDLKDCSTQAEERAKRIIDKYATKNDLSNLQNEGLPQDEVAAAPLEAAIYLDRCKNDPGLNASLKFLSTTGSAAKAETKTTK